MLQALDLARIRSRAFQPDCHHLAVGEMMPRSWHADSKIRAGRSSGMLAYDYAK